MFSRAIPDISDDVSIVKRVITECSFVWITWLAGSAITLVIVPS